MRHWDWSAFTRLQVSSTSMQHASSAETVQSRGTVLISNEDADADADEGEDEDSSDLCNVLD